MPEVASNEKRSTACNFFPISLAVFRVWLVTFVLFAIGGKFSEILVIYFCIMYKFGLKISFIPQAYDPELFSKALPCLSAIGCALSPDYSLTNQDDSWYQRASSEQEGIYTPNPVDTSR